MSCFSNLSMRWRVIKRDLWGILLFFVVRMKLLYYKKTDTGLLDIYEKNAKKYANKVAYITDGKKTTFAEFDKRCNQIANAFYDAGFRRGDNVALVMDGKTDFVSTWVGLAKIGVITAFINTNVKGVSIAHCIDTCSVKAVIYEKKYAQGKTDFTLLPIEIKDCQGLIKGGQQIKYFVVGTNTPTPEFNDIPFDIAIRNAVDVKCLNQVKHGFRDCLFYIFTSGTTGLPKAVIMRNSRVVSLVTVMVSAIKINSTFNFYNPLPLYHSTGAFLTTLTLYTGSTCVIRNKFSASNFWKEFHENDCHAGVCIGEMCRFLLATKPSEWEGKRPVKVMLTLGLRASKWDEFTNRFNIQKIVEFFGSTEGTTNLINIDNKHGACGFVPQILPKFIRKIFYPLSFIKVDLETGDIIRGRDGLCSEIKPGETGMCVARIKANDPIFEFSGYTDKGETGKKIIHDVMKKGDSFFLSGDLIALDEWGYVYFRDRMGDTFRWRGENVSTSEVEAILGMHLKEINCIVYGVEIPGVEGKCGMATLVNENDRLNDLDFDKLLEYMKKSLPSHALPYFIRIADDVPLTGTLKVSKVKLKSDAFDVNKTDDPIYMLQTKENRYVRMSKEMVDDICNGKHSF